ncbi:MAG: NUDIX domain-containing protein [Frankiales bacterium]|nr:NUDIX domain-containing protein [Frankiales bacterium]
MKDHLNGAERPLTDFPRPSVAVDTAVLTVAPGDVLSVLLVRRPAGMRPAWALPGTFLHEGERLADAVRRSLRDKAGVTGLSPQQLVVLDDPHRDARGWVLSVAHLETSPYESLAPQLSDGDDVRLAPVDSLPRLAFDHAEVVRRAVDALRDQYAEHPDPRRLVPEPFSLAQLRRVHEAVAGRELQRDTFRRLMEPQLRPTGERTAGEVGRPARMFRH